jgi:hypothetical protein
MLPLGEMTETVTVEDEAGRLQILSESGERSDLVTGTHLRSIGLNGRNIIDLAKTVPGVISEFSFLWNNLQRVESGPDAVC